MKRPSCKKRIRKFMPKWFYKIDPWPYPQTLDLAGKACEGQIVWHCCSAISSSSALHFYTTRKKICHVQKHSSLVLPPSALVRVDRERES
jgi:hypothetical protein